MMDREQLKELKEMLTNGDHPTKLHREQLLALIDAALAEPSVTDEQIRTALDYVNDYKKVAMEYDTSVGIFPPTSEEVRAWETVETALRKYQDEGCQCDQCAGTRKMSETDKQILKGRNSL